MELEDTNKPSTSERELEALPASHVFIDTSVFTSNKFDFSRKRFAKLIELSKAGELSFVTNSIVEREVHRRIAEEVHKAKSAAKAFRKEAHVLAEQRFDDLEGVFKRFDQDRYVKEMIERYAAFMSSVAAVEVPLDGASVSAVFDAYFRVSPPFEDSERKKSEFPDAFIISALSSWALNHGHDVVVLTLDVGMAQAAGVAPGLHPISSLDELLERAEVGRNEALVRRLNQRFSEIETAVLASAKTRFEEAGFWLDEEGEVWAVDLEDARVDDLYLTLPGEDEAIWEGALTVSFTAHISFEDEESGIWDSEDKRWLFRETIQAEVEREATYPLEVRVNLDSADESVFDIEEVVVNRGEDIEVSRFDHWTEKYFK